MTTKRPCKLFTSSNKVLEKNCIISYLKWPKTSAIGCDIFSSNLILKILFTKKLF